MRVDFINIYILKTKCFLIKWVIGHEFNAWLHIDAAYAGAAFICPEFRPLLNGIEVSFYLFAFL